MGVNKIGFLSFGFRGVHQPQTPILSKPLLSHQERLWSTFHGSRILVSLLQFGLQWEKIVDLPVYYLLQSFHMVRLLSSVTPTVRKTLCERFQLVFKTVIQFTTTKIFSRTCGILAITGIQMRLFFCLLERSSLGC